MTDANLLVLHCGNSVPKFWPKQKVLFFNNLAANRPDSATKPEVRALKGEKRCT